MYVRKFEADSLEEALKNIKRELGPDAIVLKTVTNKGLKGAFKKKKIEITAAISEKNYTEKAKVDSVMNDEQREKFYQSSSSHVAQQIKGYNDQKNVTAGGYGNMALNRTVKSTQTNELNKSLDNFLKAPEPVQKVERAHVEIPQPQFDEQAFDSFMETEEEILAAVEPVQEAPVQKPVEVKNVKQESSKYTEIINSQNDRIQYLEGKINELMGILETQQQVSSSTASPIFKELRNKLRALGISEEYIQNLIKKVSFDFDGNDGDDFNEVLDMTLSEMMSSIHTTMPLFSKSDEENKPTISLFVSDSTCGQTSMVQKIASLCPDSQIVYFGDESKASFTDKLLGLNVKYVTSPSEIVTTCRKNMAEGINTFVDYKFIDENDNFKKFIRGLKRSFEKVEVFTTVSAIHTETYNEKVLNKYHDVSDGIVINFIDHCLDYGMLFNLNQKFQDTPYVFYGNGDTVPDDIEAATAERILAGMFRIH